MSKPSFADVMSAKQNGRRTATTRVCFSPDLNQQYAELAEGLEEAIDLEQAARLGDPDKVNTKKRLVGNEPASTQIARKMADLIEQNPTAFYELKLEQLTRSDWMSLRTQHSPRDGVDADRGLYNADTFPPAALAASLVDPEPSEDVLRFFDENLSAGEWYRLVSHIWALNEGAREVPDPKVLSSILSGNVGE
jgi:hypothetical protein